MFDDMFEKNQPWLYLAMLEAGLIRKHQVVPVLTLMKVKIKEAFEVLYPSSQQQSKDQPKKDSTSKKVGVDNSPSPNPKEEPIKGLPFKDELFVRNLVGQIEKSILSDMRTKQNLAYSPEDILPGDHEGVITVFKILVHCLYLWNDFIIFSRVSRRKATDWENAIKDKDENNMEAASFVTNLLGGKPKEPANKNENSKKKKNEEESSNLFVFQDPALIGLIKSIIFDIFEENRFKYLVKTLHPSAKTLIYEVLFLLLGMKEDGFAKSLSLLQSTQVQDAMLLLDEMKHDSKVAIQAQADTIIEYFAKTNEVEILQGRWGGTDYSTNTNLIDSLVKNLTKFLSYFEDYKARKLTTEMIFLKQKLARRNFIYSALSLLTSISVAFDNKSMLEQSRNIIKLIYLILQENNYAQTILFGRKEWYYFLRLSKIFPQEMTSLLLLVLSTKDSPVMNCSAVTSQVFKYLSMMYKAVHETGAFESLVNSRSNETQYQDLRFYSKIEKADTLSLVLRCFNCFINFENESIYNISISSRIQKIIIDDVRELMRILRKTSIEDSLEEYSKGNMLGMLVQDSDVIYSTLNEPTSKNNTLDIALLNSAYHLLNLMAKTTLYCKDTKAAEVCTFIFQNIDLEGKGIPSPKFSPFLRITDTNFGYESLAKYRPGHILMAEILKIYSSTVIMEFTKPKEWLMYDPFSVPDNDLIMLAKVWQHNINICLLTFSKKFTFETKEDQECERYFLYRGILEPSYKFFKGLFIMFDHVQLSKGLEYNTVCNLKTRTEQNILASYGIFTLLRTLTDLSCGSLSKYLDGTTDDISMIDNLVDKLESKGANFNSKDASSKNKSYQKRIQTFGHSMTEVEQQKHVDSTKQNIMDLEQKILAFISRCLNRSQTSHCVAEKIFYRRDTFEDHYTDTMIQKNPLRFDSRSDSCTSIRAMDKFHRRSLSKLSFQPESDKLYTTDLTKPEEDDESNNNSSSKKTTKGGSFNLAYNAVANYITSKYNSLDSNKSPAYLVIDEGVDENNNAYWFICFYWLFVELGCIDAESSNQGKAFIGGSGNKAKIPMDVVLIDKPHVVGLMNIISNLMQFPSTRIQKMVYSTFLDAKDKEADEDDDHVIKVGGADKLKNRGDENNPSPLSSFKKKTFSAKLLDAKGRIDQEEDFSLKLKHKGSRGMIVIAECLVNLQRSIVQDLFSSLLLAKSDLYLSVSFLLKNLVERNFVDLKEYFSEIKIKYIQPSQQLEEPTSSSHTHIKSHKALTLLIKGASIPTSYPKSVTIARTPQYYRPDLVRYNIATFDLLSELLFGVHSLKTDLSTEDLTMLLNTFNFIDCDVSSPTHDMKESMAKYLCYIIESSPQMIDDLLKLKDSDRIRPYHLYKQIVTMLKLLYICRDCLPSPKNLKETQESEKRMVVAVEDVIEKMSSTEVDNQLKKLKARSMVHDHYIKNHSLAMHPLLSTSRLLYRFIKLFSESTTNREFSRFLKILTEEVAVNVDDKDTLNVIKLQRQHQEHKFLAVKELQLLPLFSFLTIVSSSVEVNIDGVKTFEDFPIRPECFFITEQSKTIFRQSVSVEDQSAKLVEMLKEVKNFNIEANENMELHKKLSFLAKISSQDSFNYMLIVAWVLTLALNFIALIFFRFYKEVGSDSSNDSTASNAAPTDIIHNLAQRILQAENTNDSSNTQSNTSYVDYSDAENIYRSVVYIGNIVLVGYCVAMIILYLPTRSRENYLKRLKFKYENISNSKKSRLVRIYYYVKDTVLDIAKNQEVIIMCLFHITFCALYIAGYRYFLPCHLLLIVNLSKTAKYVLMAIRVHYNQLLWTLLLVLIVILFYTYLIGQFYSNLLKDEKQREYRSCEALWSCYATVVDLGLREAIGTAMRAVSFNTREYYFSFIIFFSFFIFVNLISLNIVFGIIIDTFSELRGELEAREKDEKNTCFICGLDRREFEIEDKSFDYHIAVQHNIWNYVYFIMYLSNSDPLDMSGVETYVHERVTNKSSEWIPRNSTLYLSKHILP